MAGPAAPTIILTPFTCGHLTLPLSFLMGGRPGEITVPITAYLIEHPAGKALFDTGFGPRFARPAGELRNGPDDLPEEALVDARLRAFGIDPLQIGLILNSHLHSDHAGGNALLPAATVIVQQTEWDHAATTERGYHAPEFDTGQPIMKIIGEHDVFGDGSVVLVPTPGHTPGHQSVRILTGSGQVVLDGDACYSESLEWLRAHQRTEAANAHSRDQHLWDASPHSGPCDPTW